MTQFHLNFCINFVASRSTLSESKSAPVLIDCEVLRMCPICRRPYDSYEIRATCRGRNGGGGDGDDGGEGDEDESGSEDGDSDGDSDGDDAQSRKWADKRIAWKSFTPIGLVEGTVPLVGSLVS